ncbi:MAG: bifunctional aspartate kinase/homoserine dehydrogenase I, partial [Myxococcales bacterium]|nr:bifunctional aspartate kinase/homoserine dehydrogenase I [Myxococcales bacterium]
IGQLVAELTLVLEGVYLLREQTPRSRAFVASFGERLCAPLLVAHLSARGRRARMVDARAVLVSDERFEAARVDIEASRPRAHDRVGTLFEQGTIAVVTGFIAATPAGVTTTLGRSGSDYTATLLAQLLGARGVEIYTDVDGILTADPRLVSEARSLEHVSYREAAEMSYFGAQVIHPRTMVPAMQADIPIRIRSTFEPQRAGTLVAHDAPTLPKGVKTVTSIRELALVTVDGRGMAGVPGVARRIFEASELCGANVVMISQASSEQTVSLVVREAEAAGLIEALRARFAPEITAGTIEAITARPHVSVVSIIGQGMAGKPGSAARFFDALAAVRVNVLAIAQGASELSISVAIDQREAGRAVRAAHTTFGLTHVAHVLLVGCGRVGTSLLGMLKQTRSSLQSDLSAELRVVGLTTSQKLLFDAEGLDLAALSAGDGGARAAIERDGVARPDDAQLVNRLLAQHYTDVVMVDVTAADTGELHHRALESGVHVVTANKRPLADELARYLELIDAAAQTGAYYGYETTFGAGLPVLHTLRELVQTGDTLRRVSGCLSGTLGYLCTELEDGVAIDEAVTKAAELGYTEPDPREDLSGRDVARKALIIARAAGLALDPGDVKLDPFVADLEGGLEQALDKHKGALAERVAAAKANGETLRYVATITIDDADAGGPSAEVGLRAVSNQSAIGRLRGPDNILVFESARYERYPLVIQGPGAGADVTAAGVLGDVLRVVRR